MSRFYKLFERRAKRCEPCCEHYYVRQVGNRGASYHLYCKDHGWVVTVPKDIAEDNIANGAPYVSTRGKIDKEKMNEQFKELKEGQS